MILDESHFHTLADAVLARFFERLEAAYDAGTLDELDLQGGILTIRTETGRIFLVTKHAPTRQIWLASPVSGGLHFQYDGAQWRVADGSTLTDILTRELAAENVTVAL